MHLESFEILPANLYILVLFGVVCVSQQCWTDILEGRKYTHPSFLGGAITHLALPGIAATGGLLQYPAVICEAGQYGSSISVMMLQSRSG